MRLTERIQHNDYVSHSSEKVENAAPSFCIFHWISHVDGSTPHVCLINKWKCVGLWTISALKKSSISLDVKKSEIWRLLGDTESQFDSRPINKWVYISFRSNIKLTKAQFVDWTMMWAIHSPNLNLLERLWIILCLKMEINFWLKHS